YDEALWTGNIYPHLKEEVQPFLKKKMIMGYFVDNEQKWEDDRVFDFYLSLPAKSPGSQRFIDYLRRSFDNDIAKLNAALGTQAYSFETLPGSKAKKAYSPDLHRDLLRPWRSATAAYFYRRYVAELRRLDPDHLVLGVRWAGFPDMDLYTAVSPIMDVDSINDYNRYATLRPDYWKAYKLTGKPMIISEWSFSGYKTPGHKSLQFIEVYTQKNRGIGYTKTIREMARTPFLIGSHWFLWDDYDKGWVANNGNYWPDENMGLVSTDEKTVYTELGEACKKANAEIPALHANSIGWKPSSLPTAAPRALAAFSPKVDGDLSDWPASLKLKMGMAQQLVPGLKANGGDYYLGANAASLSVGAFIPDTSLQETGADWSWQSDNIAVRIAPLDGLHPEDESSHVQIHPTGGGAAKDQPYVYEWAGNSPNQVVQAEAVRKPAPGGFILEARLPAAILKSYPGSADRKWKISVMYEDIDGISETWWEGVLSLPNR
ncbi:MAG: hypothetical protein V4498_08250, partial [candidate division FCPU426 bacterium]